MRPRALERLGRRRSIGVLRADQGHHEVGDLLADEAVLVAERDGPVGFELVLIRADIAVRRHLPRVLPGHHPVRENADGEDIVRTFRRARGGELRRWAVGQGAYEPARVVGPVLVPFGRGGSEVDQVDMAPRRRDQDVRRLDVAVDGSLLPDADEDLEQLDDDVEGFDVAVRRSAPVVVLEPALQGPPRRDRHDDVGRGSYSASVDVPWNAVAGESLQHAHLVA